MKQKKGENKAVFETRKKEAEEENLLIEHLQIAFGYDDFVTPPHNQQWYKKFKRANKNMDWHSKILCQLLEVDVCPYCNRQYIFSYASNDKSRNTAELDHFAPKSIYPYLSCSLYNFIPSCHTCNYLKLARDDKIIYPFTNSFEDVVDNESAAKFVYSVDKQNNINSRRPIKKNIKKIKIEINQNYHQKERIENSKTLLHLEELYSKHQLELQDILDRYDSCTPQQLEGLFNFVSRNLGIQISKENLKRLIMGLPINSKKEYPLRKFKEDIINQLDKANKKI